jgi:hypothetical protein
LIGGLAKKNHYCLNVQYPNMVLAVQLSALPPDKTHD